jgi:hypothetical protein
MEDYHAMASKFDFRDTDEEVEWCDVILVRRTEHCTTQQYLDKLI